MRMTQQADCPLEAPLHQALDEYFALLGKESSSDLYALVINRIEKPLLTYVLEQTQGNQKKAAEILGLNRNTLRKKLLHHALLKE
jgi:Fis family transcriptional regulator